MKNLLIFAGCLMLWCWMTGPAASALTVGGLPVFGSDTLHLEKLAPEAGDTVEYELIIFDPGFQTWFVRVRQHEEMYSQEYLESWNMQLVTQWNNLLGRRGRPDCMPETYLNYDPRIDYGKTLNYQLFYYFRYMQERCRIFTNFPQRW